MSCAGAMVRIDDTSLWVVQRGSDDGLPVIVLHGGPGLDHHEFGRYLDPLADRGVRLLLIDLRANGRSETCAPSTWTLERMAQDVIMLALALKLDRHAVLGHSYGAFVALQNAVDYPGMAAATIVSASVPSVRWLDTVADELAAFDPPEMRDRIASSWDREATVRTREDVASLMHDQWPFHFADPHDPRIAAYETATDDAVYAPDVLRHFATASTGGLDVEDRLGEVTQPVLVLAGRHDRVCTVAAAEHMTRLLPNGHLRVFEHSAHMAFVEEPEAYVDEVAAFLGTI